ncbi:NADPH-dependent FMN reductase [Tropicibacter naphthalenivorans]|uniref:FMN-dependent NADPH-azoreductase n=1 Tax=Tropicibacter naphthalenivorans TaxID=441103 RepID=A0A0P1GD05_9RHOB|nr:NADPH-dependent FMN reductase [Tropicibacter naphthalenivorans]CUH79299.1 FMN-dependent NADPH-azoreductase [Tropicibacter naphthalenivorans]SMC71201.1 NAD(P)H-dependent FMN reductase [Tropicibacter naphthalenivorans]
MSTLKLLGISGSLRAASTNKLLLAEAVRHFGPADYTEANTRFAAFDEDYQAEHGIPSEVQTLADQIAAADAVLISTPEYNKGIPGGLKNALDWVSRVEGNPWKDKPVAIMSASAGRAGGERAQNMLRLCLNPFQPHVIPGPEVFIAQTSGQWDDEGRLTNEFGIELVQGLMANLHEVIKLRA